MGPSTGAWRIEIALLNMVAGTEEARPVLNSDVLADPFLFFSARPHGCIERDVSACVIEPVTESRLKIGRVAEFLGTRSLLSNIQLTVIVAVEEGGADIGSAWKNNWVVGFSNP